MTKPVIIDTDPGLDDAVAILFALTSGKFDVRGITTVAGNLGIDVTTRNAGRLLALLGRSDIPVVSGATAPLSRPGIDEAAIHGDDGLGGTTLPEPQKPALEGADEWLEKTLLAFPDRSLEILALGPLTNIALLIQRNPDAARRIGRIIAMGGAVEEKGNVGPRSEFNFAFDPEAAEIVFASGIDTTLIPLDVTRKVRADADYLARLRSGPVAAKTAGDLIAAYFQDGRQSRPLHDPCVMLYAAAPEIFGIDRIALKVDFTDDPGALVRATDGIDLKVAMGIDADAAKDVLAAGLIG
ncbi:MAG: nucleoside hydrolase [Devosia nanyangense]|jgi:purine nucleosidase/pyrimidine-specific ribonucleoside hydrolase|uniref:nucleoside hydrolase n=1 Tax=Paradevosia shaoguanensis TaxID=1335043 RepID=UPI00193433E1|nr:nucleoside hydrolase [Paradevosia shaoguanensis]MBI4048226.1 nucleoside hydrolase [Devosia nanyangense]